MKVLELGHIYQLAHLDSDGHESLTFIRRNSKAITHASEHAGTNSQEVLRALIDRTKFLNDIIPCEETQDALWHLRMALFCYEARAWRRKQQKLNREAGQHDASAARYKDVPFSEYSIEDLEGLEDRPTGSDGHLTTNCEGPQHT
jgi:hypothetical protein